MEIQCAVIRPEPIGRKKPSQINAALPLQCEPSGGGTMQNNGSH
jgi:hypothetical protein